MTAKDAACARLDQYAVGPVFARRVAWLLLAASIAQFVFAAATGLEWVSDEPGPLEDLQALTLLLATLAFAAVAVVARGPARMVMTGLAIVCLLMFFREWEAAPAGPVTAYLDSKPFRWHSGLAALAVAAAYIAARPRYVPEAFRYIFSRKGIPYFIALALLILAQIGEKLANIMWLDLFRTLEEIMEFNGFALLLALAVAFFAVARADAAGLAEAGLQ